MDMDGTLTLPNLDLDAMHEACGVPRNQDILTAVKQMTPEQRTRANHVIDTMEAEGARTLELMPGSVELAKFLQQRGIPTALVTRNSSRTVQRFVEYLWKPQGLPVFQPAISRDLGLPPKPHPASAQVISTLWGIPAEELLMLGDSPAQDIFFGKQAGAVTALLDTAHKYQGPGADFDADFCVDFLGNLPTLLEAHCQLPPHHVNGSNSHVQDQTPHRSLVPLKKWPKPLPQTVAALAAARGDVGALSALTFSDCSAADSTDNTPLIWAVEFGQCEVLKWLIQKGVDVNVRGFLGNTALSRACHHASPEILAALISAPHIDLDIPNNKLQYPLHFAAFKKRPEAVASMLRASARTTVLDRKGRTPAEDTSDPAIRKMILDSRARAAL